MKFTNRQRENLAKIIADIGKLFIAIVVLGQWVSTVGFNLTKLAIGTVAAAICFILCLLLDRGGK